MKKCRPSKWVPWALVGAGLPWLAASVLTTEGLKNDVMSRATTAVTANPSTSWAALSFDGRDATITGTAASQAALDAAVKAVGETYGVRTVASAAQVVPLAAPTVESITSDQATPEIKGTWPHEAAKTLAVTVAGATYKAGENPELTTDAGNWTLKLATPLTDGDYDVTAEVSDGGATVVPAATPGKLTVKLPPPPDTVGPVAPTLATVAAGAAWPYALTGKFDEADTAAFVAKVDGQDYTLGATPEFTSDGAGNFSFAPAKTFAPGSYDVDFSLTDKAGNVTALKAEKAIVVAAPADTQGPTPPQIAAVNGSVITGTFDEVDTKRFAATVDGREYVLGRGAALTSDGKGAFTFAPARKFAPGSYDVDFTAADAAGNVTPFKAEKAIVIPEPAAAPAPEPTPAATLPAPTVNKQTVASGTPAITGTWPKAEATGLIVRAGGVTYELGKDAALTEDGQGNWTLTPPAALKDGIYDVVVTASNAAGATAKDNSVAEVEVDTTGPVAPTLEAVTEGTPWPFPVTATFDEPNTATLTATLQGREYFWMQAPELTSDGAGRLTFAPKVELPPGAYNIDFALTDKLGNKTNFTAEKAIVVPPPPPPPAPTVDAQVDLTGTPRIAGSWPKAEATGLQVDLDGRSYVLGRDANLRSDNAGKWTLLPAAAIKDGVYEVVATATNADGLSTADATSNELEVDSVPPPTPTISAYLGDSSPPNLTGTWGEGDATSLTVLVPGINLAAELGKSASPLTSDGAGNWTLALAQAVTPGTYEVFAQSKDKRGRVQEDATSGELIVVAAGQTAPQPPAYDCVGLLNRISTVFPMRFNYDTTDFARQFGLSVNQYAALLNDPRCKSIHVELGGHADERGNPEYNQQLSERRAFAVLEMLKAAGVDATRLTARGYGETMPLSTDASEEGFGLNRRVELKVTKQ